jgi:hypothetical protein
MIRFLDDQPLLGLASTCRRISTDSVARFADGIPRGPWKQRERIPERSLPLVLDRFLWSILPPERRKQLEQTRQREHNWQSSPLPEQTAPAAEPERNSAEVRTSAAGQRTAAVPARTAVERWYAASGRGHRTAERWQQPSTAATPAAAIGPCRGKGRSRNEGSTRNNSSGPTNDDVVLDVSCPRWWRW